MELNGKGSVNNRRSPGNREVHRPDTCKKRCGHSSVRCQPGKGGRDRKEIQGLGRKAIAIKGNVAWLLMRKRWVEEDYNQAWKDRCPCKQRRRDKDGLMLRMKEEDWGPGHRHKPEGRIQLLKGCCKAYGKAKVGRIVNIASIVGEMGNAGQANYSASKGGVIALTKTVARGICKQKRKRKCRSSRFH